MNFEEDGDGHQSRHNGRPHWSSLHDFFMAKISVRVSSMKFVRRP